jgi:hypothetical protein
VKNELVRLVWIAPALFLLGVTGCSSFDARRQENRTVGYVEIGPQTYNTESGNFERPWPFGLESNQQ